MYDRFLLSVVAAAALLTGPGQASERHYRYDCACQLRLLRLDRSPRHGRRRSVARSGDRARPAADHPGREYGDHGQFNGRGWPGDRLDGYRFRSFA